MIMVSSYIENSIIDIIKECFQIQKVLHKIQCTSYGFILHLSFQNYQFYEKYLRDLQEFH